MQTLSRHASGPHKNSPGRSKDVYAPLAALFNAEDTDGVATVKFGLERVVPADASSEPTSLPEAAPAVPWRATMRSVASPGVVRYLVLVWQEAWSSPISRSRWILGKLVYQRGSPPDSALYSAPYRIDGARLTVALEYEEQLPTGVIPPDSFKLGCDASVRAASVGTETGLQVV